MIKLYEQFGYNNTGFLDLSGNERDNEQLLHIKNNECKKTLKRYGENAVCFHYTKKEEKHHFETSYFVGIDWIVENRLPIYVQPKQNKEGYEINYLKMLFEALEEPQNLKHLEGLCEIYFDKPAIQIEQKEDLLSPFLIVQFLQVLKKIVQKGLKKSYYPVTCNLEARVKGKVLINQTIKNNVVRNNLTKTVCRYDEFDYNCEENKILKKAFLFSRRAVQQYNLINQEIAIKQMIHYISPAFTNISDDIQTDKIKVFKPSPLYREYHLALKLALLILKRFSYNIIETENLKRPTPPFWIDMSKLFELYVFKKLVEIFPNYREVQYHLKENHQELDFLIKSNDGSYVMVVDAKYKPRYHEHKILIEDMRQVCGYARIKRIYDDLGLEDYNKNVDCLIIYSHQECDDSFTKECLKSEKQEEYVNFYKLGICLPVIKKTS